MNCNCQNIYRQVDIKPSKIGPYVTETFMLAFTYPIIS